MVPVPGFNDRHHHNLSINDHSSRQSSVSELEREESNPNKLGVHKLSIHALKLFSTQTSIQLKPPTPTFTPISLPKTSPASSNANTPISELSGPEDHYTIALENAVKHFSNNGSNSTPPNKLILAPINSTQEQDDTAQYEEMKLALNDDITPDPDEPPVFETNQSKEESIHSNATVLRHLSDCEDLESPLAGYSAINSNSPRILDQIRKMNNDKNKDDIKDKDNMDDNDDETDNEDKQFIYDQITADLEEDDLDQVQKDIHHEINHIDDIMVDELEEIDDMRNFDINAHLHSISAGVEPEGGALADIERGSSESEFEMQSDTEEMQLDPEKSLANIPHTFIPSEANTTTTMPMPIPMEIIPPGIPNISLKYTTTATPQPQPFTMDYNGGDDELPELNTRLSKVNNGSKSPPPPPIDTNLVVNNDNNIGLNKSLLEIEAEGQHNNEQEPATPDTPPTPDSPNSGSMESNSHYDRIMKNIDISIAKHSSNKIKSIDDELALHTDTSNHNIMTNNGNLSSINEQNQRQTQVATSTSHRVVTSSSLRTNGTPPTYNPEESGCSGCHACVVL